MLAADDPERRRRLADFVAKLRGLCIAMGLPAKHVNRLRAGELLSLYNSERIAQERHRDELARLMSEPPASGKAAA